jgi:hypothetical protein
MRGVLVVTTISPKFEAYRITFFKKMPCLYSVPLLRFEYFFYFSLFVIWTSLWNKSSFVFKYVDAIYYCCQKLYSLCNIIFCQFLLLIILLAPPFISGISSAPHLVRHILADSEIFFMILGFILGEYLFIV